MARKYHTKQLHALYYEELEARLLFSADLDGVAMLATSSLSVEQGGDGGVLEVELNPALGSSESAAEQSAESRLELVFIDSRTPDYQQFIDDVVRTLGDDAQVEVIILNANEDGISQISDVLVQFQDVDGIHIISHGSDGQVQLGNSWLDSASVNANATTLTDWNDSLNKEADILFYGCNIAATQQGQQLLDSIAMLTGADVAGSDDITGHGSLAGDWQLEYQTGNIESQLAVSVGLQQSWQARLLTATFQQGDANGYSGTQDTFLDSDDRNNTTNGTTADNIQVTYEQGGMFSSDDFFEGLLRFDNLFGDGLGQIPVGSTISSASLQLWINNTSSDTTITMHEMLVGWDESTTTWNSMVNGVRFDTGDADANAVGDGVNDIIDDDYITINGLESSLRKWSVDPGSNQGWAFLDQDGDSPFFGSDYWAFASSEVAGQEFRPELSVEYNAPPVISSSATASVAENTTTVHQVIATDADNDSLSYAIAGTGADDHLFQIDDSGNLSFITAPNFEMPSDAGTDNMYSVDVAVSAGTHTINQSIVVTVTDVVENVNFSIDAISNATVVENSVFTSVTPNLSGDAPIGTITYSLAGTDAGLFSVDVSTGVVSMVGRDYEAAVDSNGDNVYEVILVATDDDGNTDSEDFTVTVSDVVETATFSIDAIADTTVVENSAFTGVTPSLSGDTPIGTITYSLAGTDAGLFSVDAGTGVVSMVGRDYEAAADSNGDNVYELTLVATDDDGNTDSEDFSVTVSDMVEASTFSIDAIANTTLVENSVFTSVTPNLSGDTPIGTITYSLAGTDAGLFSVDVSTGVVSMVGRDYEAAADSNGDNIYDVTLVATDDDGNTDSEAFSVTISDGVENVNFSIDTIANATVAENSAFTGVTPNLSGDTPIGTIIYSLVGTDAGLFSVDTGSGVVSMVGRDYEAAADSNGDNIYDVTLVATDDDGNSASAAFTVTVTDVVETASFTIDAIADTTVAENAAFTSGAPNLSGAAPIGTVSYSLGGTDAGLFSVNTSTGVVSMVARNFEAAVDNNGDNVYEVTLVATDDDGNSASEAFSVTVSNVAESALFTINTIADITVNENSVFTSVTPVLSGAAPIGAVTYSLAGSDAALFSVDAGTGVVSMVSRDYEAAADSNGDNVYEVTLVATDTDANIASESFTVTVSDVVEAAIFGIDAIANTTVNENSDFSSVTPNLNGAAPIGTVTYSLSGADVGLFSVDASTGVVSMVARDYEAAVDNNGDNVYEVTLVATDDDGNSASEAFTVTVSDVIEAATFNIDTIANTTVVENSVFTSVTPNLSGAAPIGTVTYSLAGVDAGLFTVNSSTGVVSMVARDYETAADSNGDNVYEVTLVAIDEDANSANAAFTATVSDVVEVVNFGIDTIGNTVINENVVFSSVTPNLNGDTPIGNITYTLSGSDAGLFSVDASTGVVSMVGRDYESAADSNGDNVYEVTLVATDADANTAQAAFTVTVSDVVEDANFSIDAIGNTVINENVGFTSVTPNLSGAAPIGNISYSLGGTDAGLFSVNTSTGVVSMVARNFEAAVDNNGDNVYEVTLVATDADGNTDSEDFTVTVSDVVETATFNIDAIANTVISENVGFTSVTPNLSGAAPIGTVSYSLAGSDAAQFSVDANSGVVSMVGRDYEAAADSNGDNVYEVTLIATDADSNSDSEAFTVEVTDAVEIANFTIDALADSIIAENVSFTSSVPSLSGDAPIGNIIYTLGGVDAGLFTVDAGTGVVSMVGRNYEAAADINGDNVYEVTLIATDADSNSDSEAFTVEVTDAVEIANFTIDALADSIIAENVIFTSSVPSLSGDTPIGNVTYTLSGADAGLFSVDASTGVVSMIARNFEAAVDGNGDNVYDAILHGMDEDGNTDSRAFTVSVADVNEFAVTTIVDTNAVVSETVFENSGAGSSVGLTAHATDGDGGDSITYSLSNDAGGRFVIDANSGIVTVAAGHLLDSEAATSHSITVQATSTDSSTSSRSFTINLLDEDEFDVAAISDSNLSPNTVSENSALGTVVGVVAHAVDGDSSNSTITYSLLDDAGGLFVIDSVSGVITVNGALDYENAQSHTVIALATSADGSTASMDFTIAVTDLNEALPEDGGDDTSPGADLPDAPEVSEDGNSDDIVGLEVSDNDRSQESQFGDSVWQENNDDMEPEESVSQPFTFDEYLPLNYDQDSKKSSSSQGVGSSYLSSASEETTQVAYEQFGLDDELLRPLSDADQVMVAGQIEILRQELDSDFAESSRGHVFTALATKGVSASLAAGAAGYLLRAGSLFSSFLASVPLWKGFDPISVLILPKKKEKKKDDTPPANNNDVDQMFDKNRVEK